MHSLLVEVVIDGLVALLVLLWLFSLLARRRSGEHLDGYVRTTLWAVVISYVFAHVNRWFDLWHAHPYFPSGHETLAACVGAAIVNRDRRYLFLVATLLALLGYALVRAGYHDPTEVVAGFVLGTVVALVAGAVRRQ